MATKDGSVAERYKRLLEKVRTISLGTGGFWTPPQGRSVVRVLPPTGTMEFFFKESGAHYIKGAMFTCPELSTDGEKQCPICDVNRALFDAGEKDAADALRVSRTFWMNIIVRGHEEDGPRVWTPGVSIFRTIVSLIGDVDYGDISDLDDGFDLKVDREGEGLKTKYEVRAARNPSVLGDEDEVDEWLDAAQDLEAQVAGKVLDYDKLAKDSGMDMYLDDTPGTAARYDADDDEYEDDDYDDEEPASKVIERRLAKRSSRRSTSRRRSRG